jgi:hypothetical protein
MVVCSGPKRERGASVVGPDRSVEGSWDRSKLSTTRHRIQPSEQCVEEVEDLLDASDPDVQFFERFHPLQWTLPKASRKWRSSLNGCTSFPH